MSTEPSTPRTYGNWRRPVQPGIARMGLLGTGLMFAGTIATLLVWVTVGLIGAAVTAALFGSAVGLLAVRDRHGRSGLARIATRLGWRRTRRSGAHLYRSGPVGNTKTATFQLPGLAAATTLEEYTDAFGRPFALIEHPTSAMHTVVLAGEPQGAALVDRDQVDQWVAHYANFLTMAGQSLDLTAASVTVETAPDSGSLLRREIKASRAESAHPVAAAVLDEVADTYPARSSTTGVYVALTYRAAGRTVDEVARDIASSLGAFTSELSASGAGDVRPMPAEDLTVLVRSCYDPAAAETLDQLRTETRTTDIAWADAGPAAAQASWDAYRHDSAWSRTWSMSSPPRGVVSSTVLAALLQPHTSTIRKRVTLVYRPHDPDKARTIVERDLKTADFHVSGPRPTARDTAAQRAAAQIADEEARGAGLVDFGMLVTATVAHHDDLDAASVAVNAAAGQSRVQLRIAYGSQDSAFAAALPLGLVIPLHLRVPTWIADSL